MHGPPPPVANQYPPISVRFARLLARRHNARENYCNVAFDPPGTVAHFRVDPGQRVLRRGRNRRLNLAAEPAGAAGPFAGPGGQGRLGTGWTGQPVPDHRPGGHDLGGHADLGLQWGHAGPLAGRLVGRQPARRAGLAPPHACPGAGGLGHHVPDGRFRRVAAQAVGAGQRGKLGWTGRAAGARFSGRRPAGHLADGSHHQHAAPARRKPAEERTLRFGGRHRSI